jgi:death-on-curing protein
MKGPAKLLHLTVEQVLDLHHHTITVHGGRHGLRDHGLLLAALAMPRQTFGGELLHPGAGEMAAAYHFHLVMNHPFIDGNKRVGVLAALVFLDVNGLGLKADQDQIEAVTFEVAAGECSKARLTAWFVDNLCKSE